MKEKKLERSIEVLTKVVALVTAVVSVLEVLSDFKRPKEENEEEEEEAPSSFLQYKISKGLINSF